MRTLIIINLLALGVVAIIMFVLIADWPKSLLILSIACVIAGSGALSAWLWYKRGKVYEERGQSGPDD